MSSSLAVSSGLSSAYCRGPSGCRPSAVLLACQGRRAVVRLSRRSRSPSASRRRGGVGSAPAGRRRRRPAAARWPPRHHRSPLMASAGHHGVVSAPAQRRLSGAADLALCCRRRRLARRSRPRAVGVRPLSVCRRAVGLLAAVAAQRSAAVRRGRGFCRDAARSPAAAVLGGGLGRSLGRVPAVASASLARRADRPRLAVQQVALPLGERLARAELAPHGLRLLLAVARRPAPSARQPPRRRRPGSAAPRCGSRRRCPGSGSRPRPGRSWCPGSRSPGCPACGPR